MFLKELILRHFRNYKEACFSFHPKTNCIFGGNAQGKTNLLEAIYFLGTGRSFRTPHLSQLIKEGESSFYLEAHFLRDGVSQVLKVSFDGNKRKIVHNQTEHTTLAKFFGLFPVVTINPDDVRLLTDSPSRRRRFLDMHISQYDSLYFYHLIRYFRAMKQRNHLLKAQSQATISSWEEQMALSAERIILCREKALRALLPLLQNNLKILSGKSDHIAIHYQTSFPLQEMNGTIASYYIDRFQKWRGKEMRCGSSLIGPHKDDLQIFLNEKEVKSYSSEGQKRSCACALRFSEWEQLKTQVNASPLICVDDFGVHLDDKRLSLLKSRLKNFGQLFLTSPKPIPPLPSEEYRLFRIKAPLPRVYKLGNDR